MLSSDRRKITKLEIGTPKHLVLLLRRLYEDGNASVRTDEQLRIKPR